MNIAEHQYVKSLKPNPLQCNGKTAAPITLGFNGHSIDLSGLDWIGLD